MGSTELSDCKSLLLFGGSFDPPHNAHVVLPPLVRDRLGLDAVAYIPAGRAPHKLDRTQSDAAHRLAMLELAIADLDRCVILSDELERAADGRPSYTVDTLADLRDRLGPAVPMRLLLGADQLRIFDQWRDPDRIVELAEPVVMVRPPDNAERLLAELPASLDRAEWERRLIATPVIDVSSTDIRRRVAAGDPIDDLVPPSVARYIAEHALYL
jgi:nicotinate-nucleotide adenylyltransferase